MFWVHAGSRARLEQSFRDIADHARIPGRRDPQANIFKLVHDWLGGEKSGQWLLVLDNVDDSHFLPKASRADGQGRGISVNSEPRQPISVFLPQSQNGSILVTSRSKAVALELVEEKDIMAVQPMAPAHALALTEKKLGSLGEGDELTELAAALEFMPLAAKAIARGRVSWITKEASSGETGGPKTPSSSRGRSRSSTSDGAGHPQRTYSR